VEGGGEHAHEGECVWGSVRCALFWKFSNCLELQVLSLCVCLFVCVRGKERDKEYTHRQVLARMMCQDACVCQNSFIGVT